MLGAAQETQSKSDGEEMGGEASGSMGRIGGSRAGVGRRVGGSMVGEEGVEGTKNSRVRLREERLEKHSPQGWSEQSGCLNPRAALQTSTQAQ